MAKRTVTYYVDVDSTGAVTGWKKAEDGLDGLGKKMPSVKKGLLSLDNVGRLAAAGGIGLVLQKAMARSIEKGKEFETQLASLEAITGITGTQLDRLGKRSLDLSKIYGTSASNIIEANKLVASVLAEKIDFGTEAGFQSLQKVSEQAIILSKAAGTSLSDAVNTTTSIINQFNLSADESARVINTLAAGAKFGAAEIPAIGQAMVNAGSAAAGANQSIEMTNAAIQVLAANGQNGERAGTALRAIFLRLQTSGETLAKLGIENVDIKANGLAKTLQQLTPIVEDAAAMKELFGEEAFNAAQILITQADSVESLTEKVTGSNVAYEQAAVQMDTFEGATDRLQSVIDSALIPAFQESNGVMVILIDNVAGLIEQFAGGIAVINQWLDAHSDLRKELGLGATETDSQIRSMKALREELAQAAISGNLTLAQQKELRTAYAETTSHLKKRASALYDDTHAAKASRDAIKEQIAGLKESVNWLDYLPGPGEDRLEAIARLSEELEGLNLTISTNESSLKEYTQALEDGSISFEDYIAKVKAAKKAQEETGGKGGSATQINDLRSLAGLQAELAESKKEFDTATDERARAMHNARMVELQAEMNAITEKYALEKNKQTEQVFGQDSIKGIKQAIALSEKAYLESSSEAERAKHASTMTELQEILQQMDIVAGASKNNADSQKTDWKQVAGSVGQAVAQNILYADSFKDIAKGALDAVATQIISLWVRNALQTAGASGPAALIMSPILAAVAIKSARALISSFEDGGMIGGKRHSQGGTLIEAEKGEYIINRESTRRGLPLIRQINEDPAFASRLLSGLPYMERGGMISAPNVNIDLPTLGGGGIQSDIIAEAVGEAMKKVELRAPVIIAEVIEGMKKYNANKDVVGNQV